MTNAAVVPRIREDVRDLRTRAGSGYSHGHTGGRLKRRVQASERSSSFKPGANRYGWVMDLEDDSSGGGCGGSAKLSSQLRTLIDVDGSLIDESVACRARRLTAPITCTPTVFTYRTPTTNYARTLSDCQSSISARLPPTTVSSSSTRRVVHIDSSPHLIVGD